VRRARDNQRGAALVLVLWLSLFLSVVLAGVLALVRIEAQTTFAEREQLKLELAARGALKLTAWQLANAEAGENISATLPAEHQIGEISVAVDWSPEMKKVDLNLAPESSLAALFEEAGLEPQEATTLAARLADWRDHDDDARPNGAERRDYFGVDAKQIGNRAFLSTSELELVLGFPEDLMGCLENEITVMGTVTPTGSTSGDTSLRAGSRVSLTATAKNNRDRSYSLVGLARLTGTRGQPFEWISISRDYGSKLATDSSDCQINT